MNPNNENLLLREKEIEPTDEVLEIANTIMCDTRQDLCGRVPLNQIDEL